MRTEYSSHSFVNRCLSNILGMVPPEQIDGFGVTEEAREDCEHVCTCRVFKSEKLGLHITIHIAMCLRTSVIW